ncbi:unnamed protein product, partial [Oikopleura dioica]
MYETGGDLCPVKSYQLYLMKLHPLQPRLFQQPRRKATPDSPMWYGKAPIGEKALQQMMANISAAAKLSKRYTNHCVRTTALEQFSTSRRVRPAQSSSVGSSPNSSPKMSSPEQSSSRTSPVVQSPQMSPRQSLQLKAAQHAAQYQQSLQAYAQNQIMEHSLNQMKQNISQLNSFLAPQSAHSINPLSSMGVDPLYDAPPATPVYHADEIEAGQHMSAHMSSPTNVSFDSGASSPNSRASSEHRDSICKISSEDLLNFQASAEAQALMLQ